MRDWQTPPAGAVAAWSTLPLEVQQDLMQRGVRSADGRWLVKKITLWNELPQLWLAAIDQSQARLVERELSAYDAGIWSPRGTFLYRRDQDDSWQEVDPATGQVTPFLPATLRGQHAGAFSFSADGQRLLYATGICYCNTPAASPLHTYAVNLDGTGLQEVGVDVDAHWDGNRVVAVPLPPSVVRLQRLNVQQTAQGGVWLLPRPATFAVSVRAAAGVEARAFTGDRHAGQPLAVLSASEGEPGSWMVDWASPPTQPVHLWLYLAVRPEVPDDPAFRVEGGRRWVVYDAGLVQADQAKPTPAPAGQPPAEESVFLGRMFDQQHGWGVTGRGAIVLTQDGGTQWTDVTPRGRCMTTEPGGACRAYFVDPATGWALTLSSDGIVIYRTLDGGRTWSQGTGAATDYHDGGFQLYFVDRHHGWLEVGSVGHAPSGEVFRTADGGETWSRLAMSGDGSLPAVGTLTFRDPATGWLTGTPVTTNGGDDPHKLVLYHTTDGGVTWQLQQLTIPESLTFNHSTVSAPVLFGVNDAILWVRLTDNPSGRVAVLVYSSKDGGNSWTLRAQAPAMREVDFTSIDQGWGIGEDDRLYHTLDGGRTWSEVPSQMSLAGASNLEFLTEKLGWVWTGSGTLQTTDGGITWRPIGNRVVLPG